MNGDGNKMPDRSAHKKLTQLLMGIDGDKVHQWLDLPSKVYGKSHRALFHDITDPSILLPVLLASQEDGNLLDNFAVAFLHITLDETITDIKKVLGIEDIEGATKYLTDLLGL